MVARGNTGRAAQPSRAAQRRQALDEDDDRDSENDSLDEGTDQEEQDGPLPGGAVDLSLDALRKVFHLPCKDAARALGVAHSKLKRRLRKMRISRWPHRKLSSLDCLKESFVMEKRMTEDQREDIMAKIYREYAAVVDDPNHPIDKELDNLRKTHYKLKHYHKARSKKLSEQQHQNHPHGLQPQDDDEDYRVVGPAGGAGGGNSNWSSPFAAASVRSPMGRTPGRPGSSETPTAAAASGGRARAGSGALSRRASAGDSDGGGWDADGGRYASHPVNRPGGGSRRNSLTGIPDRNPRLSVLDGKVNKGSRRQSGSGSGTPRAAAGGGGTPRTGTPRTSMSGAGAGLLSNAPFSSGGAGRRSRGGSLHGGLLSTAAALALGASPGSNDSSPRHPGTQSMPQSPAGRSGRGGKPPALGIPNTSHPANWAQPPGRDSILDFMWQDSDGGYHGGSAQTSPHPHPQQQQQQAQQQQLGGGRHSSARGTVSQQDLSGIPLTAEELALMDVGTVHAGATGVRVEDMIAQLQMEEEEAEEAEAEAQYLLQFEQHQMPHHPVQQQQQQHHSSGGHHYVERGALDGPSMRTSGSGHMQGPARPSSAGPTAPRQSHRMSMPGTGSNAGSNSRTGIISPMPNSRAHRFSSSGLLQEVSLPGIRTAPAHSGHGLAGSLGPASLSAEDTNFDAMMSGRHSAGGDMQPQYRNSAVAAGFMQQQQGGGHGGYDHASGGSGGRHMQQQQQQQQQPIQMQHKSSGHYGPRHLNLQLVSAPPVRHSAPGHVAGLSAWGDDLLPTTLPPQQEYQGPDGRRRTMDNAQVEYAGPAYSSYSQQDQKDGSLLASVPESGMLSGAAGGGGGSTVRHVYAAGSRHPALYRASSAGQSMASSEGARVSGSGGMGIVDQFHKSTGHGGGSTQQGWQQPQHHQQQQSPHQGVFDDNLLGGSSIHQDSPWLALDNQHGGGGYGGSSGGGGRGAGGRSQTWHGGGGSGSFSAMLERNGSRTSSDMPGPGPGPSGPSDWRVNTAVAALRSSAAPPNFGRPSNDSLLGSGGGGGPMKRESGGGHDEAWNGGGGGLGWLDVELADPPGNNPNMVKAQPQVPQWGGNNAHRSSGGGGHQPSRALQSHGSLGRGDYSPTDGGGGGGDPSLRRMSSGSTGGGGMVYRNSPSPGPDASAMLQGLKLETEIHPPAVPNPGRRPRRTHSQSQSQNLAPLLSTVFEAWNGEGPAPPIIDHGPMSPSDMDPIVGGDYRDPMSPSPPPQAQAPMLGQMMPRQHGHMQQQYGVADVTVAVPVSLPVLSSSGDVAISGGGHNGGMPSGSGPRLYNLPPVQPPSPSAASEVSTPARSNGTGSQLPSPLGATTAAIVAATTRRTSVTDALSLQQTLQDLDAFLEGPGLDRNGSVTGGGGFTSDVGMLDMDGDGDLRRRLMQDSADHWDSMLQATTTASR